MAIYFSRKGDSALSATDGAVYNAVATMDFKHKSVLRNIPLNIVCIVGNAHSTSLWRNGKCQRCNVPPATQDQEAQNHLEHVDGGRGVDQFRTTPHSGLKVKKG
jgi:hypothetical protein